MNACRLSIGMSLVEMLVTLLVLTTGLLAINAFLAHSIATLTELVWQQRALRLVADAGEWLQLIPAEHLGASTTAAISDRCDVDDLCDPDRLYAVMARDWQAEAAAQLPGGTAGLDSPAGSDSVHATITLQWQSPRDAEITLLAYPPVAIGLLP